MPVSAIAVEPLLKRERVFLIGALLVTTGLAWAYMVREARAMMRTGVCECMGMAMAGPDTREWKAMQLLALFLMWSEMMIAMMLPSAALMILTFASASRARRTAQRSVGAVSAFVAGYLIVWVGFSMAATLLQWALHSAALLSPTMASANPWFGGALLIAAGVFQFTRWKTACLAQCANPLRFILTRWREGIGGAIRMGLHHGALCLGCCWALMLLLFVLGVMNVTWIAALTLYVLVEKLFGRSAWFGRLAGAAMCASGLWILVRA